MKRKLLPIFLILCSLLPLHSQAQTCPGVVLNIATTTHSQTGTADSWRVPSGGPYKVRLTAKGAKGGASDYGGSSGATIVGEYIVVSGQVIEAMAGAEGANGSTLILGGGGGGGSGFRIQNGSLLMVAGGGGGSGIYYNNSQGGLSVSTGNSIGGGADAGQSDFNGTGGAGVSGVGNGGGGVGGGGGGGVSSSGDGFGGGGGGFSGGSSGGGGSGGSGGGSFNIGSNQNNIAGANNAGGQVIIECLGTAAILATLTPTQPTCASNQGSVSIDLTGDINGYTSGGVEYAIVSGNSFTGTPTFADITAEPFSLTGGTGTTAGTYTVRIRLKYNPDAFVDRTYTILPSTTGTIYVKANASGTNNGSSWADAFTSLQDALAVACSGAQIWVAAGTYYPTTNPNDRDASFAMKAGVKIYGGFPNTGNPSMADRNWTNNPTILSAISVGSSVIYNYDNGLTTTNSLLDGFTITGGYNGDSGGGMYNFNSSPSLANCSFSGNTASNFGGGMYNQLSSPRLVNCSFSDNWALAYGGGMFNKESSPSLVNCSFSGNQAQFGGGIYNYINSLPSLTNCSFSGNQAQFGGGIYNYQSSSNLKNCILWGNGSEVGYNNSNSSPTYTKTLVKGLVVGGFQGTEDPLFVNAAGGDLRLQPCSPAINAGNDAANTTTTDLAGNNRKFGTIDLGAYELQRQPFSASSTTISANNLLCEGSSIRLSSSGGNSYAWAGPNFTSTLQNPTRPRASVSMSGIYSLTVSAGICSVVLTTSVVVSPNVAPSIMSLRFNNTLPNTQNTVAICNTAAVSLNIAATNAVTYSWRGPTGAGSGFTSSLVSPVNMPISSPRQGQYTVTVRNGCSVFNQRVINLQLTNCSNTRLASAEDSEGIEMEINAYPNPVSKTLTVEVRLKEAQPLQLKLLNSVGQTSGTWQLSEPSTVHRTELNLSDLTGGVYLLEAQAGEQRVVKKVVKVE